MARVSIPNEAEIQPYAPAGRYTAAQHQARIVSCEEEDVRPNADGSPRVDEQGNKLRYLNLRVMFRNPNGQVVFARSRQFGKGNTLVNAGSGSRAPRWLRQLGQDPNNFDTEDLANMPVDVEVSVSSWGQGEDKRYANDIVDIFKA